MALHKALQLGAFRPGFCDRRSVGCGGTAAASLQDENAAQRCCGVIALARGGCGVA